MSTDIAGLAPKLRAMSRKCDKGDMSSVDLDALLAALREETKPIGTWSGRGLSLAAGGKADLVRDLLRGENKSPGPDTVVGLARAMKRDLAEFIKGEVTAADRSVAAKIWLPVTTAVAAGVWLEHSEWPHEEQYEVEVTRDPDPTVEQFVVEMRGYSMDRTIQPNSVLECTRVAYGHIEPRDGDLVIVERQNHDLTEMTCKRLKRGTAGWELRCESTKPEFQDAIQIGEPSVYLHVDNEIRVIGIVEEARQIFGRRGKRPRR
jgi:SOS-response transcriptional repressor LexA